MSSFKLNDSLNTQQLVDVMNNVNQLVNYLQESGVSIDVNSSNSNGDAKDSVETEDSVEAQQETAALEITLTTPLGTITFSVSLDLPIEELLNILMQLITTVVCTLFPNLGICSGGGASSQTEDNSGTN